MYCGLAKYIESWKRERQEEGKEDREEEVAHSLVIKSKFMHTADC